MNEELILKMVEPSVKEGKLTYKEFDRIFDMLSLREQYQVTDILYKNSIELVEIDEEDEGEEDSVKTYNFEYEDDLDQEDDEPFYDEPLYDESLFEDDTNSESESDNYLLVRKKISIPRLTLIQMIQAGNQQAKQDFCIQNKGLVEKWASKYVNRYGGKLDFEDLMQAGMIGLIKAAERFNIELGYEFSTYAVQWIRQCIVREIFDTGFTIRIPVHMMERINKVLSMDSKYAYELDYNERLEMISEEIGMRVDQIEYCLQLYYKYIRTTSLDMPIGEEEDTTIGEMIPYEDELSTEDLVFRNHLKEKMSEVLGTLKDREREIIELRYGIADGRCRTLEEIGQKLGVTRERIRQIESKAIRKMRHPSRSRKLKDFLN